MHHLETADITLQAEFDRLEATELFPAGYQQRVEAAEQQAQGHGTIKEPIHGIDNEFSGQFKITPRDRSYWQRYRESFRYNERERGYAEDRIAEIEVAEQTLRDLERERGELRSKKEQQLAAIRERMLDWQSADLG